MNKDQLKKYSELFKKPVKNVSFEGNTTILEFEDGKITSLYGGGYEVEGIKNKIYFCSFCGREGTKDEPVVSLNEKNDPVVCPKCATEIIQIFIDNGIEIELDITKYASKEIIESLIENKIESKK